MRVREKMFRVWDIRQKISFRHPKTSQAAVSIVQVDGHLTDGPPLVVTGRPAHGSVEKNEDHIDQHIDLGDNR